MRVHPSNYLLCITLYVCVCLCVFVCVCVCCVQCEKRSQSCKLGQRSREDLQLGLPQVCIFLARAWTCRPSANECKWSLDMSRFSASNVHCILICIDRCVFEGIHLHTCEHKHQKQTLSFFFFRFIFLMHTHTQTQIQIHTHTYTHTHIHTHTHTHK